MGYTEVTERGGETQGNGERDYGFSSRMGTKVMHTSSESPV
jgi:hypothetical protein